MPKFNAVPSLFGALKDQVIVLTGGARGVGESIVRLSYLAGAHVFFGDIDHALAQQVVGRLKAEHPSSNDLVAVSFDARSYADNIRLFKTAYQAHGRVDHAFSIAAITESQNWYDPGLDLETIEIPPPTAVIDINLTGVLYFTRIAAVYLRQGNQGSSRRRDKSICLMGSIASFREQAGLYVYQPTKHGVHGLLRATRKILYHKFNIRINMVNPSHIDTVMGSSVHDLWESHGLPVNTAEAVAEHVLTLASLPEDPYVGPVSGLAIYVEGGKGWEIEEDLDKTDHLWMGEEMSRNFSKIQEALGLGVDWEPTK
ncbi:hypothetical protein A1O3_04067 [Capronia epimyces CBS 606.96]|uniref:3-oxoacyl-[acyl-carrier protein] reductase n=1 Tax=Capronia epimyces CBS 606.96 TaxID=1182542 RepID=W9YXT5_9EURO|nr:uncharacterized protein A1O3_04067 [Capronia epimyces CBS 606.96]EXJ87109.1 hypothetical protein A1O3_04067 [Capronia epimyces CBS 606.96]